MKAKETKTVAAPAEVKVEAAKTTVEKTTPKTTAAKKSSDKAEVVKEVTEAAKETVKKPAAETKKKATTVKKAAATKEKSNSIEVFLQYAGNQVDEATLVERVKADCKEQKVTAKDIKIYLKPEENACYYVANGKLAGRVNLY